MSIKTLVINPGSTSTKVGVFEDETLLFEETLRHPTEEIAKYVPIMVKLCYAIAGVVAIVGAISVYIAMSASVMVA